MRLPKTTTTILLASALLAGCGEGGSGGRTTTPVVSAPSAPVVTPGPAPTPTPAPIAADPLAGWGTACNGFATDLRTYAMSANVEATHSDRSTSVADAYIYSIMDVGIQNMADDLSFVFDAKQRTATTLKDGIALYAFAAGDVVDSNSSSISYRNGTKTLSVVCEPGSSISFQRYSADLHNPALGVPRSVHRAQLTGVPTATTAETSSGIYVASLPLETFRTDVQDAALRTEAVSNVAPIVLTFDKAAGTILGRYRTNGSQPIDVTISIDRQIGTRFTGTISASDGAKGEISGGFYGLGGREIGFVTTFEKFGVHYVGAGGGKRG